MFANSQYNPQKFHYNRHLKRTVIFLAVKILVARHIFIANNT